MQAPQQDASGTTDTSGPRERSFAILGDGCRLAYRLDGPADAPVLLLATSIGAALEMWEPQLPAFTEHFRVLRYDSRGHGASEVPPGAYSIDRLGRDAVELLDALGIARAHFCGLSMGGMVGQWLGVRAPERIQRLVLANTAPYIGPPGGWQERIALVQRHGMGALVDGVLERWFTPEFRAVPSATLTAVRAMLLATAPEGFAGCCAGLRDMDLRPVSAHIAPPALLIAGTRDLSTPPEWTDKLARAMRPAPRVVRLDASHLSNMEQPDAFSRAVIDFLAAPTDA